MATKTLTVCDVCEEVTSKEDHFTITGAGADLAVDLCAKHSVSVRQVIKELTKSAPKPQGGTLEAARRRVTKKTTARKPKTAAPKKVATAPDSRAVRAWAKSQGIDVSPTGMVPRDVVVKFQEAGN